jgi:leucyl-tRNA synthetase
VAVDEAQWREGKYWLKDSDQELQVFNTKMSKSLLNVVVPDDIIQEYGVDTFRIYMMFMGPLDQNKKWDMQGIKGCERFIKRVLSIFDVSSAGSNAVGSSSEQLEILWGKTLAKVDASFISLNFNTAIAAFMEFMNQAEKNRTYFFEQLGADFIKALFPFAPHICSEVWERLGLTDIDHSAWPTSRVREVKVTRIYINGTYVDELRDGIGEQQTDVDRARNKIFSTLEGRSVKKVIYVPKQIINFLCDAQS